MLDRYSHVRMEAKREAVSSLKLATSTVVPTKSPTIEASRLLQ
jgi:hypothetical protein